MAKFLSGKRGKVTLGGSDFNVVGWSCSLATEEIEVSHSGGSGFREYISGLSGGSGSFDAVWDTEDPITNKFPQIEHGAQGAVILYAGDPDVTVKHDKITATIQVTSFDINVTVEGRVEVSCSFVLSGSITYPD